MGDTELVDLHSSSKKEMNYAWGISEADDETSIIKPKPRKRLETVVETPFNLPVSETSSTVDALPPLRKPMPRRRKQKEIVLSPRDLDSPASKPSASDSGFVLSPGRSSAASSHRLEDKGISEADDDDSVEVRTIAFRPQEAIAETSFDNPVQLATFSPVHSFKKPVPSRRKQKLFSPPQELASPVSKTSTSEHVLVHSPGRSSVSSRGRGEEKDSGPSSLPARADTPASISSQHPSVGETSLDGSRSLTSQSDTRSYRERIRDRVRSERDKAASGIVQAHQRSRLKQRLLAKPATSRFDLIVSGKKELDAAFVFYFSFKYFSILKTVSLQLQKEERQVEEALQKHETTRSKWKSAAENLRKLPSEQECYDFFTQVWDSETEETEPHTPASVQETEEIEHEGGDQTKLITSEYLGLQDEWDIVEDTIPTYLNMEEVHEREKILYFYPDSKLVPVEAKLPPDQEPRYPEAEGLYIGTQLPLSGRNRCRVEQRILVSGELKWFGDDGEIISIPDPRSTIYYKPPLFDDVSPLLETQYKDAVPLDLDKHSVMQPIDLNTMYLLGIEIQSIVFTHHPLFSREHVLAKLLKDLYEKHCRRVSLKNEDRLGGRLQALRRARNALRISLEKSADTSQEQKERLRKYNTEIREVRQMHMSECRRDRQLLGSVLQAWRDLKEVRELQQYINTPYQLRIHAQQISREEADAEQEEWEKLVQAEWEDFKEEKTEEFTKQKREYKKVLAQWKKKRKHMQKTRRQQQREKEESIEMDDDSTKDEDSEDEVPMGKEPKPPNPIDWSSLRNELEGQLKECFRPPGEPKLFLELTQSATITIDSENPREQQRRAAVKRCSLFIRLLYNGQEVCRTKNQPLTAQFEVILKEKVAMRIAEWPESLKVELYEEGGSFGRHVVAEVFIPIPSHTTAMEAVQSEPYEFSNTQVITFSHAGVGCGTYSSVLPSSRNIPCLYTTGVIMCCAGWATEKSSGKILSPPEKYCGSHKSDSADLMDIVNLPEGTVDMEKLRKWAESSPLDPNDPSNSSFFYCLKNASMGLTTEPTYFRLDPLQSEFDFCRMEDIINNPRLRLLYLRDRGEPEFRGLRQVPIREKEISEDVFKAYEKRLASPQIEIGTISTDPLDIHRAWGKRFLQEIRQRILKQCRQAQQYRKLEDIVTEDQVPDIGTLGLTFMQWLQPKRPLKPARKERKKVTVQGLGGQDVRLIINVVRAFDVPVRKDIDTVQQSSSSAFHQSQKFSTVPVRPFVEVTFQGVSKRTTTALGNNPTWNQDLQLPMRPPSGDFTPGNLQEMQDTLHLHLFDEIVVDLLEDDRMRDTNIHQRLERHWLGSLSIPFITLYHNARIEGTFKLYSPPVLLGYEREPPHRQFSGYVNEGHSSFSHQDSTFLTIFISVQPALNPPEPFKEQLECGEPPYLQEHLQNWEQEVLALYPHRKPKTLVVDISGKSMCVTRFIRAIAPPEVLEGETTNAHMAARFVSMIPSVAGSVLFPGLFDIWLSSDQVLRLLSGDSEDHAVLLCCYLLYMRRRAWVLLGTGIPHGPTAYVLEHRGEGEYCLWDPASGQFFDVHSSFCPLRKVFCLINDENIWANVQNVELPQHTKFDVNKRSDWWPAFGRGIGSPTTSIQPQVLEYNNTSPAAVQFLQDKIEKHLRDSLVKWRRTARTYWNRYCVAILRKLLPALERETWKLDSAGQVDHIHELQHILGSHKMCGFPINMPYTNMAALTESVRSTGVYYIESPEVEFALAVYIHPYPNNVLSVWIYVASLMRRR
ncbi:Coiled-coil and C2 domain-containing protein 2A [Gryllus bimaculatus]|nr:Coiled-coil and C2 domain-containing protein 2A [Gryllus bimaculatus]